MCSACQHVCTMHQELLQCACVRVSRALPMTLCNCSPDTLSCPPMNHCSLPCVRSQSCTRSNSLDHLSRARANSPQNRSGYSRLFLYHAAWSSLTCLSSILRQTSRTSSAHSNSYSYALAKTSARSAPPQEVTRLFLSSPDKCSIPNRNIPIPNLIFHFPTYEQASTKLCTQLHDATLTKTAIKYL